jgi:AraC-like DNA-binding protein
MVSIAHLAADSSPDRPRTDAPASFKFFRAPPPLGPFVEYLYFSHVPAHFAEGVEAMRLPEVEAQLVFAIEQGRAFPAGQSLSGGLRASLFLQPAHLQFVPIPGTIRQAVGAALKPAGLRLLLSNGAAALNTGPLIALEELWGVEGRLLLERIAVQASPGARLRILEQALRRRLRSVTLPTRAVERAFELAQLAHGEVSTEQLAHAIGCTSRTLRSLTLAESGMTPKHLARIFRIRRALELLGEAGVPLTDAALTSAFSDHAHMSREFRELLGEPPSQVRSRIRSTALPRFSAERNLISTGLLVLPKRP